MRPHFNHHIYNPNNNNLRASGANASGPQQVMGNSSTFCPNPVPIRPQFQAGMLNNSQLAMLNTNSYFAPAQFLPFPQASFQNMNTNNLPHIFAHNAVNQHLFVPNGQLSVPNLVQNVNRLLQTQIPNCGLNNSGLFVNAPSSESGNGLVLQSVGGNINHNAAVTKGFVSPPVQQNQNVYSSGAGKSQSNSGVYSGIKDRKSNWRKSRNKNFFGNRKHDASERGFGKRQFYHQQSPQGNIKFNNENHVKGNKNNGMMKFNFSNSREQIQTGKKRSLVFNYTDQEIQQWRADRRKNYPSNVNMEKKLKENPPQPEVTDEAAKMRRQQLKEILAKQAELGCEVAEIPSCYLSDSEIQMNGRPQNNKVFGKRERFQNKFDKKGKIYQCERFTKRQRAESNDSANFHKRKNEPITTRQRLANGCTTNWHTENKREPSLLKKLLSSDIKRDKKHLLQVFRFMVMNSFFENGPEKVLKFPHVIVKESDDESEPVEEERQVVKGEDISDGLALTSVENHVVCNGDVDGSCSACS